MIDHIGISVSNMQKSKDFYLKALAPLKYELIMDFGPAAGFGENRKPDFWISEGNVGSHVHVSFRARNRLKVDEFYAAAMAAGGKDNGAPGIRAHYHTDYYGAFVIDPDGHNIEACCHDPE